MKQEFQLSYFYALLLFLTHTVQMKQYNSCNLESDIIIFLTHTVQMKQMYKQQKVCFKLNFLTHTVQMKRHQATADVIAMLTS